MVFERLTPATKIMMISECGSFRVNTLVIINLFVFPINFGDAILNTYDRRKLASTVKVNQNFDTNSGIASSFHRIMRKVNKDVNPNAANELMASVRVKAALEAAINQIVTIYVTKISGICNNSLRGATGTNFLFFFFGGGGGAIKRQTNFLGGGN